jgi:hypothetical protein
VTTIDEANSRTVSRGEGSATATPVGRLRVVPGPNIQEFDVDFRDRERERRDR